MSDEARDVLAKRIAQWQGDNADVYFYADRLLNDLDIAGFDVVARYRTKTGKVLTEADIEALADEAERGYDVEVLLARRGLSVRARKTQVAEPKEEP